MSVTPQVYAKARSEIIALFGWNADSLSPDQTLRVDCAVALRLCIDDLQGKICRGESVDVARMLTASEALARLLPPAVLATPPAEQHGDPRQVMWEIYKTMRERGEIGLKALTPEGRHQHRIEELEAENERLRVQLGVSQQTISRDLSNLCNAHKSKPAKTASNAITPTEADITPPSEYLGVPPMSGPDDPPRRSTAVIEATAAPAAAPQPQMVDLRAGTGNSDEPWRDHVLPTGEITAKPMSRGRWWGPV
jgi:hypothetical protein